MLPPRVRPRGLAGTQQADLFDRKLRFNPSVFYYDYKNLQVSSFVNGILTISNAANAEIYGLDLDATAAVAKGLTLSGGPSILHARYKDFNGASISTPLPAGGNLITSGSAAGKRLQATPDWTLNLAIDYAIPIGPKELQLHGDYYYNDGWYPETENRVRQPHYKPVQRVHRICVQRCPVHRARLGPKPHERRLCPRHGISRGYMPTAAAHQLLTDNILDLSHADYLHPDTLGGESISRSKPVVFRNGDNSLNVSWTALDEAPLPIMRNNLDCDRADMWTDVVWYPNGVMVLSIVATPSGAAPEAGTKTVNAHIMTPDTDARTHYFYCNTRNSRPRTRSITTFALQRCATLSSARTSR